MKLKSAIPHQTLWRHYSRMCKYFLICIIHCKIARSKFSWFATIRSLIAFSKSVFEKAELKLPFCWYTQYLIGNFSYSVHTNMYIIITTGELVIRTTPYPSTSRTTLLFAEAKWEKMMWWVWWVDGWVWILMCKYKLVIRLQTWLELIRWRYPRSVLCVNMEMPSTIPYLLSVCTGYRKILFQKD